MDEDREAVVDWGLHLWAAWMRNSSFLRALWYPQRSAGFISGGAVTTDGWLDSEDECHEATVTIVNTAINNLPPDQRQAIHYYCDITRVLGTQDAASRLQEAKEKVLMAMTSNGCGL